MRPRRGVSHEAARRGQGGRRKERMNSLFLVVLGLSLLVDLALGAWAGANFPHFAKVFGLGGVASAGLARPDVAQFLAWVLATCLVGFAAIQGIAFHWTRRDKDEGPQLAIVFGCWLVLSSLATFAFVAFRGSGSDFASMGWKFLLVDGLRGAALAVLGYVAVHAPAVVRELRLPDSARQPRPREERAERAHPQRRDDRPHRRDEGRGGRGREDRGRSGGGREGRGRDSRQRPSSGGHDALKVDTPRGGSAAPRGPGPQRADAPRREHAGQRREEPQQGGRSAHQGRRLPPTRGAAIAPDLESRAVAEARRIMPDTAERPLTVVVRGTPERIRSLSPDDGYVDEVYPVAHSGVAAPGTPLTSGEAPLSGGSEALNGEDGGGRRRRRRRSRGGAGPVEPRFEDGSSSSSSSDYDDLDEPVVVEREFEERGGGDSGEGQEGVSAARGRSRRRRRPSSS